MCVCVCVCVCVFVCVCVCVCVHLNPIGKGAEIGHQKKFLGIHYLVFDIYDFSVKSTNAQISLYIKNIDLKKNTLTIMI